MQLGLFLAAFAHLVLKSCNLSAQRFHLLLASMTVDSMATARMDMPTYLSIGLASSSSGGGKGGGGEGRERERERRRERVARIEGHSEN